MKKTASNLFVVSEIASTGAPISPGVSGKGVVITESISGTGAQITEGIFVRGDVIPPTHA